ncbi:hypothetical protein PFISCL1PPCAC_18430, partial [Pristionchus fissidentatus]
TYNRLGGGGRGGGLARSLPRSSSTVRLLSTASGGRPLLSSSGAFSLSLRTISTCESLAIGMVSIDGGTGGAVVPLVRGSGGVGL